MYLSEYISSFALPIILVWPTDLGMYGPSLGPVFSPYHHGGWRLEIGGWGSWRGWRLEVGGWTLKVGGWRLELLELLEKLEKLEVGGWRD